MHRKVHCLAEITTLLSLDRYSHTEREREKADALLSYFPTQVITFLLLHLFPALCFSISQRSEWEDTQACFHVSVLPIYVTAISPPPHPSSGGCVAVNTFSVAKSIRQHINSQRPTQYKELPL